MCIYIFIYIIVSFCLWLCSWRRCTRPLWCSCGLRESGAPTWTPWSSTPNCGRSRPALGTGSDSTGSAPRRCPLLKSAHLSASVGNWVPKLRGWLCPKLVCPCVNVRLDSPACPTTSPTHGSKTMKCPVIKKPYRYGGSGADEAVIYLDPSWFLKVFNVTVFSYHSSSNSPFSSSFFFLGIREQGGNPCSWWRLCPLLLQQCFELHHWN